MSGKTYTLTIAPAAARQIRRLSKEAQKRLKPHIDALAENPRPHGALKLTGGELYRIRIGAYRVIYEIQDKMLVVLIVKVAHRRESYR